MLLISVKFTAAVLTACNYSTMFMRLLIVSKKVALLTGLYKLFSPECSKNLHSSKANVLFAFITKLIGIKHEVATIRGCV